MIVCHCGVVTDTQVRQAIASGATDVCSLAAACGTGRRCGGCLPKVRGILAEHGLPTDDHLAASELRTLVEQAARHVAVGSPRVATA